MASGDAHQQLPLTLLVVASRWRKQMRRITTVRHFWATLPVLAAVLFAGGGRQSSAQGIPGVPSPMPTSWSIPALPIAIATPGPPASGPALYPRGMEFMDPADYLKLIEAFAPSMGDLAPSVDLSADFPAVGDQGQQGSCVAWAVGYGFKSFQEHEERSWSYATKEHLFSPAFIFNHFKKGKCGGGVYVSDAFELVSAQGIAPLSLMPYSESDCSEVPSAAAKAAAKEFSVHSVKRVPKDIVEIKGLLATRSPIVVGLSIDSSFDYLKGQQVWYGPKSGAATGGHAMVIVGYDDARQAVRLYNSWGKSWGDNGLGWVSYPALIGYGREMYIAKSFHANPSPTPKVPDPKVPDPNPPKPATGAPTVTLSAPSTMKNILVGETYYFGLAVGGTLENAQNRKYDLVVRFKHDGKPIKSSDAKYADSHGRLAARTPKAMVSSPKLDLGGAPSLAIPQQVLRESLGVKTSDAIVVEAYYDVYVDSFFVGRSPSAKITFIGN
jgi:hypothetical protein